MSAVFAFLILLQVLLSPGLGVIAYDETGEETVLCRRLVAGERFVLAYTNSMYGGDVRETFTVTGDGKLRRLAMHTEHPAAADYYAFTVDVVPEGELYRIDLAPAEFNTIAVRIDDVGAPRLLFADGELDLLAATGNQHRIILSAGTAGRLAEAGCR